MNQHSQGGKMYSTDWLQVEISALCQAGCIDCNRWRPFTGSWEWKPGYQTNWLQNSSYSHMNTYYDIDEWDRHISMFSNVRHLQFCGNMGDPMAHPRIVDCCKSVLKHLPGCNVDISTNGGLGKLEHYKALAKIGVVVSFAVDGLSDTNQIYRRGVNWTKVIDRMKAFIDAGGKAQWQWIRFPHNEHQIDQGKQLAKQMGFDSFDLRERFTQDPNFDKSIILASKQPVNLNTKHIEPKYSTKELEEHYQEQLSGYKNYDVDPGCMNAPDKDYYHPSLHINVDGSLWPCCYTANLPFHTSPAVRHWWKSMTKDYKHDWNNLHSHTPEEIIQSHYWQNVLPNSWKDKTNIVCLNHCGKCKA